jgi:hypothetical protein
MNELIQLWLPIVTAAVLVFVASSLIHMVFKWHNSDYRKLSNEDEVAAALRAGSPTPGQYVLPHCTDMKAVQDEAVQARFRQGPVGFITLKQPGPPAMGGALLSWFVLNLALAIVVAWMVLHVYGLGADPSRAACLAAAVSFLAYGVGSICNGIWMARPWICVAKDLLDAAIYAGVTALAFWWLWPMTSLASAAAFGWPVPGSA